MARCEEEANSRRDAASMEDMMPPSYSDEEYGNDGSENDSEKGSSEGVTERGKFYRPRAVIVASASFFLSPVAT